MANSVHWYGLVLMRGDVLIGVLDIEVEGHGAKCGAECGGKMYEG